MRATSDLFDECDRLFAGMISKDYRERFGKDVPVRIPDGGHGVTGDLFDEVDRSMAALLGLPASSGSPSVPQEFEPEKRGMASPFPPKRSSNGPPMIPV